MVIDFQNIKELILKVLSINIIKIYTIINTI